MERELVRANETTMELDIFPIREQIDELFYDYQGERLSRISLNYYPRSVPGSQGFPVLQIIRFCETSMGQLV